MRRSLLLLLAACTNDEAPPPVNPDDVPFTYAEAPLTGWVDPMIGTAGAGNTIPGALVPHGMVRASPDTHGAPGAIDAYRWEDTALDGFSHTHLEGPGGSANGYSQILLLPQAGPLEVDREARAAPFDHASEVARPGYYKVSAGGVDVELTATSHAAIHRYRFPAGEARVLVDVGSSMGASEGGALEIAGAEISGHGEYVVHPIVALLTENDGTTGYTTVYTAIELSQPPTDHGVFQGQGPTRPIAGADTIEGAWSGAWAGWTFTEPTTVEVRVGVSYVSVDQARRNLREELPQAADAFEQVAASADAAWNHLLNRAVIEGTDAEKRLFYTALYRSAFQPTDHTEAGGAYAVHASGAARVLQEDGFRYLTDDWCQWDTFRTLHPFGTIFEPELRDDIARSALLVYREGGWLDKCPWSATGYSRVMIANPTIPILTHMFTNGLNRFDADIAWEAIDKSSTHETPEIPRGLCGFTSLGTPPEYESIGYVPDECDPSQSVSLTLEHAVDDAAAARFAAALGLADEAEHYATRSGNWRNTFDMELGFARPRYFSGGWVEPFSPDDNSEFNGFTEATSWIYSFHVMHDVPGLIEAMGGVVAFRARLDAFFDEGRFDISNQPSFHIPWLYAAAGDPAGTQRRVRDTLDRAFTAAADGLPGNDDAGSTSAWAVLAGLGMYPIDPSADVWTLSTPRYPRAELRLHPGYYDGGSFVIEADGDPASMPYIASATLNGQPLERAWIRQAEITAGGTLRYVLSAEPTGWGAAP